MGRVIRDTPNTGKLTEIGKIKIGDKKLNKSGKEYPVSLDYFRATGDYANLFYEKFGDKCSNIPIVFVSDDLDVVCNEEYVIRDGGGRKVGSGDGKNWMIYDAPTETYLPKHITLHEASKLGKVHLTLTLRFLITDIKVLGYWRFETRGELSSIPQVRDTFDFVQKEAGTIIQIPFDLQVKKVKSQKPGVASMYPVVSLIPNLSPQSIEKLYNFLEAGNKVRGMLTSDRVDQLLLEPTLPSEEQTTTPAVIEDIPFEDIRDDDDVLEACNGILMCVSMEELVAHWKSHKSIQNNATYEAAKNEAKLKFSDESK